MFQDLAVFRLSQAMAIHAGARQALLAQNIAHADTPGYRVQDIAAFEDIVKGHAGPAYHLRATRAGHIQTPAQPFAGQVAERSGVEPSPNGNSVSLEEEMVHAADVMRAHEKALAIYRSSLSILRSSLGRR